MIPIKSIYEFLLRFPIAILIVMFGLPGLLLGHEKETSGLVEAFKSGDADEMAKFFGKEVHFIGEHRFVGGKEPLLKPTPVTAEVLKESYARLIKQFGKEEWKKHVPKIKPSTIVSKEGGELKGFVKEGDVVCDMHLREATKGKRNGFDEAVIFVLRKQGDTYKVVFHLADF